MIVGQENAVIISLSGFSRYSLCSFAACIFAYQLVVSAPALAKNIEPGSRNNINQAKVDCLVLEQDNHYGGEERIWVAPNAVKAFSKRNKVTIVSKSPEWKVYVFNDRRRVVFSTPLAKWQGGNIQGLAKYFGHVWDSYDWVKTGSQNYAGLKANKFKQGNLKKGAPIPERVAMDGEYLCYDEVAQDPHVMTFLHKLHIVPEFGSIPLFLRAKHSNSDPPKIGLETIKASKEKVDPSIFAAPSAYKSVRLENDIYSDESMQGLLEDLNN